MADGGCSATVKRLFPWISGFCLHVPKSFAKVEKPSGSPALERLKKVGVTPCAGVPEFDRLVDGSTGSMVVAADALLTMRWGWTA